MTPKRIIFAGTPDFSVPCLQALINSQHIVCAVYTQPDRRAGRGRQLQASPVKQTALEHNIPVYQPLSLKKDAEARTTLAALEADLMVVVAYGLILPQTVLDIPRYGCINVHASILPRWRGAAPIQRALIAGDTTTGITLMQMDAGLDTGDMLHVATCPILPDDTGQTLHDRLAQLGADSLATHINHIETLPHTPQDDQQATYANKLSKDEAHLDWQQPAAVLERQVRAFNPWPIAQADVAGQTLRIWAAQALVEPHTRPLGSIIRAQRNGIDIATGEGMLRLLKVQKAGGRPIAVSDFLNAQPQFGQAT